MSGEAPGPGWWLASNGEWYPQQWEYLSLSETDKGGEFADVVANAHQKASALGQQGWEMVGFTTDVRADKTAIRGANTHRVEVHCMFKRPLRH